MSGQTFQERILAVNWEANKRTLPRERRVSENVLDEVETLRDQGKFREAIAILESQAPAALSSDPVALNGLGHFFLGSDEPAQALTAFKRAEEAARLNVSKALVNQAHALKVMKRYDEGMAVAERARDLASSWFVPYLMQIAILECRYEPSDRAKVKTVVDGMMSSCPDWASTKEIWDYLANDVDYARLRTSPDFELFFGKSIEELKETQR